MTTAETSEHVRKNREHWERESDEYQERNRAQLNGWDHLGWGVYDAPEDEVGDAQILAWTTVRTTDFKLIRYEAASRSSTTSRGVSDLPIPGR